MASSALRTTLDLGCGRSKLPGALGMDSNPRSHADIVHDLDVRPWPIDDSRFDHVRAQDVMEHVVDFIGVMEEIHRVCHDGATVDVRMPFMSSVHFATDPTHRRAGTSKTFAYFDFKHALGEYGYTTARFELIYFRYGRSYQGIEGALMRVLDIVIVPWCQWRSAVYEHYFAYIYPMHEINYRLRVIK